MKIEEVEGPNDSLSENLIEKIFELRYKLNDKYISKNILPAYPFESLEDKESQNLLRTLLAALEEEIFEVYSEVEAICEISINTENFTDTIGNCLMELNVEIADVNLFFFEIFSYLNIEASDIADYYSKMMDEDGLRYCKVKDTMQNIFMMGQHHCINFRYINNLNRSLAFSEITNFKGHYASSFYKASHQLSKPLLKNHSEILFQVCKNLNKIKFHLKNKFWRATSTKPNLEQIHLLVMEAWLHWAMYMSYVGMNGPAMYNIFYKKTQINLDRIENGY